MMSLLFIWTQADPHQVDGSGGSELRLQDVPPTAMSRGNLQSDAEMLELQPRRTTSLQPDPPRPEGGPGLSLDPPRPEGSPGLSQV
ncbi:hypothetical protein WMY93_032384 [Mugilogobius chulae]|uniref:Uncharacterized protein n=1 Tax=Mugilogobius chulae TaxID=88201 RepID=A0AAW0MR35_9GOBI